MFVYFSDELLILDSIIIILCLCRWYMRYRREGCVFSFFEWAVLFNYIIPIFVMYPFAGAEANFVTAIQRIVYIRNSVDGAFLIYVCSFFCFVIGKWIYDYFGNMSPLYFVCVLGNNIAKPFENLFRRANYLLISIPLFFGLLYVFYIQVSTGYLFNPRAFFMVNGAVRPIYNIVISMNSVIVLLAYSCIRFRYGVKRAIMIILSYSLIVAIFLGARAPALTPLLLIVFLEQVYFHKRITLLKMLLLATSLLFLMLALYSIRQGKYGIEFVADIFYGNNFSDLRDFAWILAYWDGELLWGKTVFADLMGFIPRFLSEFREKWSFGMITTKITGIYVDGSHPGLRPGVISETYFNFGILGVVFVSMLRGYVVRYLDIRIHSWAIQKNFAAMMVYTWVFGSMINIVFMLGSGQMWQTYVMLLVLLLAWILKNILTIQHITRNIHENHG